MIKPNFRHFWPAIILIGLLSCTKSPFDPSTNEGANILNSLDSTIANFKTAYRIIDTTAAVLTVGSNRDSSYARTDRLEAGSLNGEQSFGYFIFDTAFHFANQSVKSIDSVKLFLPLTPGYRPSRAISIGLFRCARRDTSLHKLLDTGTVQPIGNPIKVFTVDSSSKITSDTLVLDLAEFRKGLKPKGQLIHDTLSHDTTVRVAHKVPISFDTTLAADSVTISKIDTTFKSDTTLDTIHAVIFRDTVDSARIDLNDSGYCLRAMDNSGSVARFSSPLLNILPSLNVWFYSDTTHTTVLESRSAIRVESSVYETNPTVLNDSTRSSYTSGRYTVIKLDLSAFWDSVKVKNNGKRFSVINGCNLIVPFDTLISDTEQFVAEKRSAIVAYYHIAPYHSTADSANFNADKAAVMLTTAMSVTLPLASIQSRHNFSLDLHNEVNALYAGGSAPPAECNLFIRLANSSDVTWRWVEWRVRPSRNLHIQATASNPR
jgi:hypothetical protein